MNKPFSTNAMVFIKNMMSIFITNPPLSLWRWLDKRLFMVNSIPFASDNTLVFCWHVRERLCFVWVSSQCSITMIEPAWKEKLVSKIDGTSSVVKGKLMYTYMLCCVTVLADKSTLSRYIWKPTTKTHPQFCHNPGLSKERSFDLN